MQLARLSNLSRLSALALGGAALVACSDATGTNTRAVSLSFAAKGAAPAAALAPTALLAPRAVTATAAGHTLVVSKAQIVLKHLKFEGANDASCATTEGEHDDCEEVKVGPLVVDLPLDATVQQKLVVQVPAGTYDEVNFLLHPLQPGDKPEGVASIPPELQGYSVRVEGTYDGTPFVYTGTASQAVEMEFPAPVTVDKDGLNLTINVVPTDWFTDGVGYLIDPATANPGQPNEQAVTMNIKRSFRALHDDNRDGRADD